MAPNIERRDTSGLTRTKTMPPTDPPSVAQAVRKSVHERVSALSIPTGRSAENRWFEKSMYTAARLGATHSTPAAPPIADATSFRRPSLANGCILSAFAAGPHQERTAAYSSTPARAWAANIASVIQYHLTGHTSAQHRTAASPSSDAAATNHPFALWEHRERKKSAQPPAHAAPESSEMGMIQPG